MKEIAKMSVSELQDLAVQTNKVDVLWDVLRNCKGDERTIQNIAANPLTRFVPSLVREIFDRGDIRVKLIIARHTQDVTIIDEAAHSDNRSLRAYAALNPNISLPTLVWLAKDAWWGVRVNAMSNKKNSNNLLGSICSSAADIATSIPDYSQLPLSDLRERATETESLEELRTIFENCKGDAHTIQKIIENPYTRHDPELVRKAYDSGDTRIKITIARDTVDKSIIDEASYSSNRSIRASAALNPNISMETLLCLSKDTWWGVRASVLSNARITNDIIRDLYNNDLDLSIRNLAREILEKTAKF